jgi:Family of unknown function (DUF6510)
MSMDHHQDAIPLDGNATAGLLRELFAFDVTAAVVTCDGCGKVAQVGDVRVYGGRMGAIFRCAHCDTVVIRLTHTPAGLWLDMRGARGFFVQPPPR